MHRCTLAALLLLASSAAVAGTPLPDAPHVVVQGEGELDVAPDWVMVTMVARQRAAEPGEAKRVVDRAVESLMQAMLGFDIAPDDVSASDLQLSEERGPDDEDRPRPPQHIASREVTARINDLGRLGAYIDAALAAGFTDVSSVQFKSTQEARLRTEARRLAVADATEKASGLAQAFGGNLGPVYSINSLNSFEGDRYGNMALDRIEVTGSRINNGRYLQPKIEFTERVSAVFEISR